MRQWIEGKSDRNSWHRENTCKFSGKSISGILANHSPQDPCMLYMITFTINLPPMLPYIAYMDPSWVVLPNTDLLFVIPRYGGMIPQKRSSREFSWAIQTGEFRQFRSPGACLFNSPMAFLGDLPVKNHGFSWWKTIGKWW